MSALIEQDRELESEKITRRVDPSLIRWWKIDWQWREVKANLKLTKTATQGTFL
jgi:hypothetical protein